MILWVILIFVSLAVFIIQPKKTTEGFNPMKIDDITNIESVRDFLENMYENTQKPYSEQPPLETAKCKNAYDLAISISMQLSTKIENFQMNQIWALYGRQALCPPTGECRNSSLSVTPKNPRPIITTNKDYFIFLQMCISANVLMDLISKGVFVKNICEIPDTNKTPPPSPDTNNILRQKIITLYDKITESLKHFHYQDGEPKMGQKGDLPETHY
jgi:hypothetical protein